MTNDLLPSPKSMPAQITTRSLVERLDVGTHLKILLRSGVTVEGSLTTVIQDAVVITNPGRPGHRTVTLAAIDVLEILRED